MSYSPTCRALKTRPILSYNDSDLFNFRLTYPLIIQNQKAASIDRFNQLFKKTFSMLIGQLVEKSGMTKDTIRFYEKKGLIANRKSRRDNNYKEYSEAVLNKLLLIWRLKDMGFTLNEINTFLELWQDEDASCQNLKYTLEKKISQINDQFKKLAELKERLTSSLTECNKHNCEFEKIIPSSLSQ
jgi:MerR family copper efflux transcriptional regulator